MRRGILCAFCCARGFMGWHRWGAPASSSPSPIRSACKLRSGASGLMIMPPYLLRPPKQDVLNHFRRIRDAVPLPIMVYNVPILAGVELTPEDIQLLAGEGVIQSVKWSHVEVSRIHDTKLLCGGDFTVFVGIDLVGLEGLAVGADGYIGGLAMMTPARTRQ